MEVLKNVIFEMIYIVIIGIICLIIYIYGKLFLIKIRLLEENNDDELKKINKDD